MICKRIVNTRIFKLFIKSSQLRHVWAFLECYVFDLLVIYREKNFLNLYEKNLYFPINKIYKRTLLPFSKIVCQREGVVPNRGIVNQGCSKWWHGISDRKLWGKQSGIIVETWNKCPGERSRNR